MAHSALGLWILLGAGKIAVSSGEDQADWKGLNRFLRINVAGEAMIAAPNIERVITYRYPEMAERQVDLDSLETLLESQDPPRIYLVKSRYTTDMQQAKIVKLLSRDILQPFFQVPGFKVYISK
jgi:hypothetical protein